MATLRRAFNADEPGLGKSAQFIRACDLNGARVVQVTCPACVAENWRREFKKFQTIDRVILPIDADDIDEPNRVIVSSYEKTERDSDWWIFGAPPDALGIDEAHKLKNRETKRTTALYGPKCDGVGGLVERAGMVFPLSGTPSPNNPAELWAHIRALAPRSIHEDLTYWKWVNRYCHVAPGRFGGMKIIRGKNLKELRARISPFFIRRKADDVLPDLPEVLVDTLLLTAAEAARELAKIEATEEGKRARRALEAGGTAALKAEAQHVATYRRLVGVAKAPAVVKWVRNWLDGGGVKIVLFAYHREVIDALAEGLKAHEGLTVFIADGRRTGPQRQVLVDVFKERRGPAVFIGQIEAAGTGMDGLQHAARDLIFVESSWVDDENNQVIRRLKRIGQKNAVLARFAALAGSLDEQIQRACARKARDNRELFG